ncbi:MAG TPA: HDOD domain-containing protein [Spirochaetia bacterium]|nr:HDOD domain-containing protein [Spirochaetia bacterium]
MNSYIERMPSLPTTVSKILQLCNDPKTSPADLNKLISLDPVLMGRVMKLINSAYYSLAHKVTSLVRAIIMLGINTVKNLALSTAVLTQLGGKKNFQALNMEGFWRHSICVGVTAKLIAKRRKVDPKELEEYFIGGLLHDIGKVPLNNRLSKEYYEVFGESERRRIPLFLAEHSSFELDHTEVGKLIIENWRLSEDIRDVVQFHHRWNEYDGKYRDIVFTVAAANYFANVNEIGFAGDRYPETHIEGLFSYLEIDWDYLDSLEEEIKNAIAKAQIFLEVSQ